MTPLPPPGHRPDPRPAFWTTGTIFLVAGLMLAIVDNPLVPLSHVFHLVPLGIGGAIGTAILCERYGPRWVAAYVVLMLWLLWSTWNAQTTGAVIFLAAGVHSLTRAIVRTVGWD